MKHSLSNLFFRTVKQILRKPKKEVEMNQLINSYKKKDVNMNDLMQSINLSNDLYNKMKVEFHPDKFQNSVHYIEIVNYYQEITRNKRDYKQLCELNKKLDELLK